MIILRQYLIILLHNLRRLFFCLSKLNQLHLKITYSNQIYTTNHTVLVADYLWQGIRPQM